MALQVKMEIETNLILSFLKPLQFCFADQLKSLAGALQRWRGPNGDVHRSLQVVERLQQPGGEYIQ